MAFSPLRLRPAALPVSRKCIWKNVGQVAIELDIYLPSSNDGSEHPIMLYIHGGAWTSSNKSDYSRPLFHQFLSLGFVIVSTNYRLLPETSFIGQLEDIQDIETWLRSPDQLASILQEASFSVDIDRIIVVGGSAGAHLALLTPKIWSTSPTAILSCYGPTNMHRLPSLNRGRLALLQDIPVTSDILAEATDFSNPPTDTGCPPSSVGFSTPRSLINLSFFQRGTIAEFLLRGLITDHDGELRMPERGCATSQEIDAISPLHISQSLRYPPVYQFIGTSDDIFETYHVTDFHHALSSQGIRCEKVLIPDAGHAFDIYESIGGDVDRKIITPAVNWVAAFALKGTPLIQSESLAAENLGDLGTDRRGEGCCC